MELNHWHISHTNLSVKIHQANLTNGSSIMSVWEIMVTFGCHWSTQKFRRWCQQTHGKQISICLWSRTPMPRQAPCSHTAHSPCYMHSAVRAKKHKRVSKSWGFFTLSTVSRLVWDIFESSHILDTHILDFRYTYFRFENSQEYFLSHQSTKFLICLWYSASSSLLIFPTTSASSAHFTKGSSKGS